MICEHSQGWYSDPDYNRSGRLISADVPGDWPCWCIDGCGKPTQQYGVRCAECAEAEEQEGVLKGAV